MQMGQTRKWLAGVLVFFNLIAIVGCQEPLSGPFQDVGTLTDLVVRQGAWGVPTRTEVRTTQGVYIILGTVSAPFNAAVRITKESGGYLCIDGVPTCQQLDSNRN